MALDTTLDTTLDGILNRRIMLAQPKQGFRVAVDTVLLAAAVPTEDGETVLELGCGVGGVMLALAARVSKTILHGIEIQPELAALAHSNITRNEMGSQATVEVSDVTNYMPSSLFDHVMMNPPYHDEVSHDVSENAIKRTANSAKDGELPLWFAAADRALKPGGCLTIIHRADQLPKIVAALAPKFMRLEVLEILPKAGMAAKRVVVRSWKETRDVCWVQECLPLVLHKDDGAFSDDAEQILRHAKAVAFKAQ